MTISQVELINKKKFVKVALDENVEAFIVYAFFLSLKSIHPDKKAQIASLVNEKIIILDKYLDFVDVFLEKQALVLPEQTELNQYAIEL